jgi:hypothetical protein
VVLDVGEMRLDVPKPVGALVALVANAARMEELALDLDQRQGHKAANSSIGPLLEFFR